jgi:hypothetical protein
MAKALPQKHGEIAAMPAPPPAIDAMRTVEDAKTINAKPNGDPLGEAIENFEGALREKHF